jgi:hypothetical protein
MTWSPSLFTNPFTLTVWLRPASVLMEIVQTGTTPRPSNSNWMDFCASPAVSRVTETRPSSGKRIVPSDRTLRRTQNLASSGQRISKVSPGNIGRVPELANDNVNKMAALIIISIQI